MKQKRFSIYPYFASLLILAAMVGVCVSAYKIKTIYDDVFPQVSLLKTSYPIAVERTDTKTTYIFSRAKPKNWISIKSVPHHVIAAILLAEDSSFYQHRGYSADSIRDAIEHNNRPGVKIKRGGSTITQQVVKNLFLSREKTIERKLRELLLSVELERNVSKSKILETYLNIAEWGPGLYGIAPASQKYFGHSHPANLTARESAMLAFMLPNPKRYRYSIADGQLTAFASRRVEAILKRMWKTGHISDEEYTSSVEEEELPSEL